MLCLFNYDDYLANEEHFKHCKNITPNSIFYAYVPSLTSLSAVTGNVHRLSFADDLTPFRTAALRRVYLHALISLSRIIFPLK